MITINIISDTICPWCFIGKRKLERALAEKPPEDVVRIEWQPFQLNPDMPAEGLDRASYLNAKFGGPEGARQVYDRIRAAGRSVGIAFDFETMPRTPNSVNSHRLIRRAGEAGLQDAVVEALFRAYFLDGGDVSGVDSLVDIATAAGMDADDTRAYLESDADVDAVRAEDQHARRGGVQGVPFFVFNNKYAISGAQDPAVFHAAFEKIAAEPAEAPAE